MQQQTSELASANALAIFSLHVFLVQGSIVSHAISIMSAHIRAVAHSHLLRLKSFFV